MDLKKSGVPHYDASLMFAEKSGAGGMPEADLPALLTELEGVKKALMRDAGSGAASFFTLPDDLDAARISEALARELSADTDTLIVSGIGGSDLGARALIHALAPQGAKHVRFIGANMDPEETADLLASVDLSRSILNVVSKSGDTIEPLAAFLILREKMEAVLGPELLKKRIVVTTGADGGALHEIALREGYRELAVPKAVGGRFSALTTVGFFPAAWAGVSAEQLLAGAEAVREAFLSATVSESGPLLFAGLVVEAARKRGQTIDVVMPYAESLRSFAFWYRQLWAESLGKARDRKGNEVYRGLTPIAALGATDQHSQLQLYNEGPNDKVVTFLEVGNFRDDFAIPAVYPDIAPVARLGGHSMSGILHAERDATARTLASHERPSGTIRIDAVTPETIGALMMFFMIATAAAAEMLDINAYDQPGVEESKRFIGDALSRKS